MVPHVRFLAFPSLLFQKPGWAPAPSQAGDGYVQEINLPRLGRKGPSAGRLLGWWREREEPPGPAWRCRGGRSATGTFFCVEKFEKKPLKICQNCAHPSVTRRWQRPVPKALRRFRRGREAGVKHHGKEENAASLPGARGRRGQRGSGPHLDRRGLNRCSTLRGLWETYRMYNSAIYRAVARCPCGEQRVPQVGWNEAWKLLAVEKLLYKKSERLRRKYKE